MKWECEVCNKSNTYPPCKYDDGMKATCVPVCCPQDTTCTPVWKEVKS
jgi:hypothetical protein